MWCLSHFHLLWAKLIHSQVKDWVSTQVWSQQQVPGSVCWCIICAIGLGGYSTVILPGTWKCHKLITKCYRHTAAAQFIRKPPQTGMKINKSNLILTFYIVTDIYKTIIITASPFKVIISSSCLDSLSLANSQVWRPNCDGKVWIWPRISGIEAPIPQHQGRVALPLDLSGSFLCAKP